MNEEEKNIPEAEEEMNEEKSTFKEELTEAIDTVSAKVESGELTKDEAIDELIGSLEEMKSTKGEKLGGLGDDTGFKLPEEEEEA